MNINDTSAIRQCTSCQLCGAVCPTKAITITLNEDGFYRPVIDKSKCIDCSLCVGSCYKFDPDIHMTTNMEKYKLYSASVKDLAILKDVTSGGIADSLAVSLVSKGYKCIGVEFNPNENCAVGTIASTLSETERFRGSKYIQSYSVKAFEELVADCRKQPFAVFGLPCQIYAVHRLLTKKGIRENHILIDLYCHGCPSLNLWKKYTQEILDHNKATRILSSDFRSKIRGWGNFYTVVVVEKDHKPLRIVSPRVNDKFYELFFSDLVLNDSCSTCKLRSTLEYADIRLGDFWGHSYTSNHKGVSAVTVMTTTGQTIIDAIKDSIHIKEESFDNFLPYQSYGKRYAMNQANRQELLRQLNDRSYTLDQISKAYHNMLGTKKNALRLSKNFLKLLPNTCISSIKHIGYLLRNKIKS